MSPDETGWKVGGHLHWLWAFATPDTTVYAIQPGRGFAEAAAVLGPAFPGVLVRDGWAPYRRFTHAAHQTCLAQLLRRCRLVQHDHPRTAFPGRVHTLLQQALAVRDRATAGTISAHGRAGARGHLLARLGDLLDHPGRVPDVQRFAAHLSTEFPAIFSFLFNPTIDAHNWKCGAPHFQLWGYPFNRSKLRGWFTLGLARTIRGPLASFRRGSGPMRTASITSSGYDGPPASPAWAAAALGAGAWLMVGSCAPGVTAVPR